MTTNDKRDELYNALCDELTNRGIDYRKPDVFGFVAGCWPTESDASELADDWIEAQRQARKSAG